jgi:hypothetical protein
MSGGAPPISLHAFITCPEIGLPSIKQPLFTLGARGRIVVKALHYKSMGPGIDPQCCRWGFFPEASTVPYALGLTQPLKMSTRETPGGEGGRCVRVTTLPPS